MYNNLKIILYSNKANTEFKLCLHQLAVYGFIAENLRIYETSPVNYTFNRYIMDKYKIPYIDCSDLGYTETMNKALLETDSPYALLLDSHCFLKAPVDDYLRNMEVSKVIRLLGEITNCENYQKIHKRVQPWWCLVDLNHIRENGIQFSDINRIKATQSEFLNHMEYTPLMGERHGIYYAPGSTMYEDVTNTGGFAADIGEDLPYIHVDETSEKWLEHMYKMFNYDETNLSRLGE